MLTLATHVGVKNAMRCGVLGSLAFVPLALVIACGGESSSTEPVGGGGTAGGAGFAGSSGQPDAAPDVSPDAPADNEAGSPWAVCFGEDGTSLMSWDLKLVSPGGACIVKEHRIDCCGNFIYMGVAAGSGGLFDDCEAAWRESLGECNCPQGPGTTEQPKVPVDDPTQVEASGVNCTSESCLCMSRPAD